jgi:hypothetical protein
LWEQEEVIRKEASSKQSKKRGLGHAGESLDTTVHFRPFWLIKSFYTKLEAAQLYNVI